MTKPSTRGEMDITTVFGTVIGGSSPSGCTETKSFKYFRLKITTQNKNTPVWVFLFWCAARENRTPDSSLARTYFTTKP